MPASVVAAHRLQQLWLMGFSSCGSRAYLLCGMWDLPGPGLEPVSLAWKAGRFILEQDYIYLFFSYSRNIGKGDFFPSVASEGTSFINGGRKRTEGLVSCGVLWLTSGNSEISQARAQPWQFTQVRSSRFLNRSQTLVMDSRRWWWLARQPAKGVTSDNNDFIFPRARSRNCTHSSCSYSSWRSVSSFINWQIEYIHICLTCLSWNGDSAIMY